MAQIQYDPARIASMADDFSAAFAGRGTTAARVPPDRWLPVGRADSVAAPARPGGPPQADRGREAPADGVMGIFRNLIGEIDRTIASIGALVERMFAEAQAEAGPTHLVGDATLSSTGDPHLAETGTVVDAAGNARHVDAHFDSMSGHENLLSSRDVEGGYRVSTVVTPPNPAGVTTNESATVHANDDGDRVTMHRDGSIAIVDDGREVTLGTGESIVLHGGETVTRGVDGALTVSAAGESGASIATTLRATGSGVDVSSQVRDANVGGDIVNRR